MRFKILCVGKVREDYYGNEIEKLCREIRRRGNSIEIIELSDIKIPDNLKEDKKEAFLEKECSRMHQKIDRTDYVIALCIEGKEMDSNAHKAYVHKAIDMGKDCILYIIGGSLGLPKWVKDRADLKLSFSKMTFPHQLMRMVLLEEIAGSVIHL